MTDNWQPQSDNSVRRTTSGLRWGHRTRSVAVAATVALIASAVSALIAPGKADAAALCASSRNPYAGAHVVRVYSPARYHGAPIHEGGPRPPLRGDG